MKKIIYCVFLMMIFAGCSTVNVSKYIQARNPYEKSFYSEFDQVLKSTSRILEESGWKISGSSHPSVYENNPVSDEQDIKQIMLISDVRQFSFFLGTKYTRINAFIKEGPDQTTIVELRCLSVTSLPFKSFDNYKRNKTAEKLLNLIEQDLNG